MTAPVVPIETLTALLCRVRTGAMPPASTAAPPE